MIEVLKILWTFLTLVHLCYADGSIDITIKFIVSTDRNPSFLCSSDLAECTPKAFPLHISVKTNKITKSSRFIDVDGVVIGGPIKGRFFTKFERKFSLTNIPSPISFIRVGLDLTPRCNDKCGRPATKANGSFPIRLINYKQPAESVESLNFGTPQLTVNATISYNYRCEDGKTGQNCHCTRREESCPSKAFICKSKVAILCCPVFLKEDGVLCIKESSTIGTTSLAITTKSDTTTAQNSISISTETTVVPTSSNDKNVKLNSSDQSKTVVTTTSVANRYDLISSANGLEQTAVTSAAEGKISSTSDGSGMLSKDNLNLNSNGKSYEPSSSNSSNSANLSQLGKSSSNETDKLFNPINMPINGDKNDFDLDSIGKVGDNIGLIASVISSVVSTLVGIGGLGAIATVCCKKYGRPTSKSPEFTVAISCADQTEPENSLSDSNMNELSASSDGLMKDNLLKGSQVSLSRFNPFSNDPYDANSSKNRYSIVDMHIPTETTNLIDPEPKSIVPIRILRYEHPMADTPWILKANRILRYTQPMEDQPLPPKRIKKSIIDQNQFADRIADTADTHNSMKKSIIDHNQFADRQKDAVDTHVKSMSTPNQFVAEPIEEVPVVDDIPVIHPEVKELENEIWEMAKPIPSARPTLKTTLPIVYADSHDICLPKRTKSQRVSWHADKLITFPQPTVFDEPADKRISPDRFPQTTLDDPENFEAPSGDNKNISQPQNDRQNLPHNSSKSNGILREKFPQPTLNYFEKFEAPNRENKTVSQPQTNRQNLPQSSKNSNGIKGTTDKKPIDFYQIPNWQQIGTEANRTNSAASSSYKNPSNGYRPKSFPEMSESDSSENLNSLVYLTDEHLYDCVPSDLSRNSTPYVDAQQQNKLIPRNLVKKPSNLRRGNYIKKSDNEASQLRNSFLHKSAEPKAHNKLNQQEKVWYSPAINSVLKGYKPDKLIKLSVREPEM